MANEDLHEALTGALTDEPGRVLSVLVRALGDVDLAEEALQDAATAALERWPADGVPSNPAGWLVTTARRRAIDRLRRINVERQKRTEMAALTRLELDVDHLSDPDLPLGDERLALILACCHPTLPMASRVALTLRCVGGLTTDEVARAFLTTESTMKQRITRAKRALRDAAVSLAVPTEEELEERIPGVLAVLYLIFNEGYVSTRGDRLTRLDLSSEAIRLTRLVASKTPSAETLGLLALMLFHVARGPGRHDGDGALVPMEEQDRSSWDRLSIEEANGFLAAASKASAPGPYQLQAAIASVHANASRSEDTNWVTVVHLYDGLVELLPTAFVRLNRAVAYAMVHGPAAGLVLIDGLEGIDGHHLLHAARADMLRRLGRADDAAAAYSVALELTANGAERRFLERRLAECRTVTPA